MAQKQNVSYQEIVGLFQTACQAHDSINSFDVGTIDFLDASAVNRIFPYIFLRPINTLLDTRSRTLTFELYSLDQPKNKSQSNTKVMSTTEFYIYDLMAYFNYNTDVSIQQNYQVNMTNCVPVNEGFQDRVFGWVATIDVVTPFALNYCKFPTYPAVQ